MVVLSFTGGTVASFTTACHANSRSKPRTPLTTASDIWESACVPTCVSEFVCHSIFTENRKQTMMFVSLVKVHKSATVKHEGDDIPMIFFHLGSQPPYRIELD